MDKWNFMATLDSWIAPQSLIERLNGLKKRLKGSMVCMHYKQSMYDQQTKIVWEVAIDHRLDDWASVELTDFLYNLVSVWVLCVQVYFLYVNVCMFVYMYTETNIYPYLYCLFSAALATLSKPLQVVCSYASLINTLVRK